MKKTLLLIASVAMAMAACTNDVAEQEYGNVGCPGEVAISASLGTRTSMSTNAAGGLDIAWVGGEDQIGIFANDEGALAYANVGYTATESGSYSAFAANNTSIQWGVGVHNFYAYYPYTEVADLHQTAVPASIPAVQEQAADGDLAHIQPLAFMYASKQAVQGAGVDFSFVNAFSVLEVALCAEVPTMTCEAVIFRAVDENEIVSASNIYVNLTNGSLDYSSAEATNEIRINMATPLELNNETPVKVYAMVTPGHGGKQFQAVAVVNGAEVVLGEMGIPESGLPAGKKAALSLNVPAPVYETVDLCADGKTANTYIVPAVGTYSFKATVKGNGYTGAIQSNRYAEAEYHTFVNGAAGADQTSVDLAPASAEVLWFQAWCPAEKVYETTCPILAESVVLTEEGNVEFTTTPAFIPGNAVIAVKDAEGNIIWSWQIWLSEGYDPEASQVAMGTNNIVMMDRNIGANINSENGINNSWIAAQAVGMMYQHGRKDPFPGPFDIDRTCRDGNRGGVGYGAMMPDGTLMYGSNGPGGSNQNGGYTAIAATEYLHGLVQHGGLSGDWTYADGVAYANANPHRLIHNNNAAGNSSPYDWWGKRGAESRRQLFYYWGGPQVWPSCADIVKTIYDPCPAGWVVPGVDFSKAISDATVTAVNYGWNVTLPSGQTAYFPKTGVRWGDATNLQKCNTLGAYWVNAIGDGGCGAMNIVNDGDQNFLGVSNINNPQDVDGMNCLSMGIQTRAIRCVKEAATVTPEPEPEPTDTAVDLSANGTANCYIVNAAATEYKFKATVKGNGAVALAGDNAELAPAKAAVLWSVANITDKNPKEDGGGWPDNLGNSKTTTHLIDKSTVELKDGYIRFKTQSEIINGNVIIAAMDEAGNIVWSWHLWILNGYDAASSDHYVTASNVNSYMMDRNLGATASPDRVDATQDEWTQARGFYYQWGRKDPFMGSCKVISGYAPKIVYNTPEGVDSVGYAQYGSKKLLNSVNVQDIAGWADVSSSVAYAVANPRTFIAGNGDGSYSWVAANKDIDEAGTTAEWGKLWGNQEGKGGWDKGGVKTMYDPCPVGYRVPSAGHFRFITSHGDDAGAYYNKMAEWKYNCVEQLFNEAGEALNATNNVAPYGLNFYIKGSKTAAEVAEGAQNYGNAPEDKTTAFFPAQGLINWSYADKTYMTKNGVCDVLAHTNLPNGGEWYGFSTLFMKACRDGEFYSATNSYSYAEQQAKALPVRCFREQ